MTKQVSAEAATRRPWGIEATESNLWIGPLRNDDSGKVSEVVTYLCIEGLKPESEQRARANAELIVASVNDKSRATLPSVGADLDKLAREVCHAVEQRSDDCNMEMHARVKAVLFRATLPSAGDSILPSDKDSIVGPTCGVCNWTNVGCLNLARDGQLRQWWCHGCIQRKINPSPPPPQPAAEVETADGRVEAIADEYANLLHRPNISYDGLREGIARAIYKSRATLPSAGEEDSERLDWLAEEKCFSAVFESLEWRLGVPSCSKAVVGNTIREAIDTARGVLPSPPPPQPPQPAADDEQQRLADEFYFTGSEPNETSPQAEWTAEQQCHRALSSLYLAVDKSIADDVKKHVMARIEELERERDYWKAEWNGQTERYDASLDREADLTAALATLVKAGFAVKLWTGHEPDKAQAFFVALRTADALLAIKPASALTATTAKSDELSQPVWPSSKQEDAFWDRAEKEASKPPEVAKEQP